METERRQSGRGISQEPLSTKAKITLDKIRKLWYNVENRKARYGDGDKASCTVTRDGGNDFRKSTTCDGAKKVLDKGANL